MAATLKTVTDTANGLGVSVGSGATALLDAHSVSFGDGAISLHNAAGIPLRSLGTGSTRLLIAGLHRAAANTANIVLVDEIEYGLEPHRLTRLLGSLGAKETSTPLQVFMTSRSPVVLRRLAGGGSSSCGALAGPIKHWRLARVMMLRALFVATRAATWLAQSSFAKRKAVGLIRGLDEY